MENERIHNENLLIKEALKATICSTCGGPPFPQEEHEHFMRSMEQENALLKQEVTEIISFTLFVYFCVHMRNIYSYKIVAFVLIFSFSVTKCQTLLQTTWRKRYLYLSLSKP